MENNPLRAACYGRYSTVMQREESLSGQLRAMKKYCEEKGWIIVRCYMDRACSGSTDKRPCRDKPADEIIRIEGGVPAIISKEIWEAVQQRLHRSRSSPRTTKAMHLLSGKVRCGVCGAVMEAAVRKRKGKESFRNYVCRTKAADCDNLKEIDSDSLERCAVDLALTYCDAPEALQNAQNRSPALRTALQSCIHSITVSKRFVLFRLYVNGEVKLFRRGRKAFRTPTQRGFK